MKVRVLSILFIGLLLGACQSQAPNAQYLITKNSVGKLTKDTQVYQLKSLFANDSVVAQKASGVFSGEGKIVVYAKGGKELLRLKPIKSFDSTSTIASVEVLDAAYKTADGLGRGSYFKVLKSNYDISRIENIFGAAMVFVDEMNLYVTINKDDILKPTQMGTKIKTSQIKEDAKIQHLWVYWD